MYLNILKQYDTIVNILFPIALSCYPPILPEASVRISSGQNWLVWIERRLVN